MAYCSNCGKEVIEGANNCGNCGHAINKAAPTNNEKQWATLAVVLGALSFYPFVIIGSVVAFIVSLIAINKSGEYKGRAKIGLGLAIGSFVFWMLIVIILILYVIATGLGDSYY